MRLAYPARDRLVSVSLIRVSSISHTTVQFNETENYSLLKEV